MKTVQLLAVSLFLIFSLSSSKLQASHYMGGEITWECIPSGQPNARKYIFTMKVYRECGGIQFGSSQTLSSNGPVSSIPMTEIAGWPKDISPDCNLGLNNSITCAGATTSNTGAVEEHIYRSAPVQLNGVPPAAGWMFYWGSCCRNPCTNIPNATSLGWRLRAIMYPYGNQNAYPCFDNSPTFAEVPRTVICTGYPFTYNHNAFDKELDSLHFEWGQPLLTNGSPITNYSLGYAYNSPLPGTSQNPNNVPAVVNPNTGTISFTSYTTGAYVTSTKVTAYKCGVKVAEIWRDMQVVLLSCGYNNPPVVTAPFGPNIFTDTVFAGDNVCFNMSATDLQFLPSGQPQTMFVEASGAQFGSFIPPSGTNPATYSTTSGCLQAPCATLTPAPGPGYPLTGIFGVQTQFCWQTTCDHLAANVGCGTTSNVYTFVLKVMDDYCPAPAIDISTITIVVLPKPTLPAPEIQCVKVQSNGDVELSWTAVIDTLNSFDSYRIYSSNSSTGPFILIDSIYDRNQTSWTHVGANANADTVFYEMRTLAGCPGQKLLSTATKASTIYLNVTNPSNGTAILNWNATHNPLLASSTGWYKIYREYLAGTWVMLDSTQALNYVDTITVCNDTINYRIEIADTMMFDTAGVQFSCNSVSNSENDYFSDVTAPNVPIIDSVSIDLLTGNAILVWDTNAAGDTRGYIIYLLTNGLWTPIDTVWGKDTINYMDIVNPACGQSGFNTYAVAAIDSCDNPSALSLSSNTMNLSAVKDICEDKIVLSWNSYNNMTGGIASYDIYMRENNGPLVLLNSNLPIDTGYVHNGLNNGSVYCYFIRAVDNSGTRSSTSCIACETANKPDQPQFVYIRTASVLPSNNAVYLKIHTDTSGKVSQYRVERYDQTNAVWNQIASLPPDYTNPTISYTDATALVRQKSYRYRVIAVDSCGLDAITSSEARSVFLKVKAKDDLTNELTWTKYIGFLGSPTAYEVYRSVDGVWDPMPIISLPSTQLNYIDDVQSMPYTTGQFEYLVKAVEGGGNSYGFADTARSNIVESLQKPKLYVPTGFNPASTIAENKVLIPRGVFINSKDYTFIIYSRWGEKLFETNEINKGWDGTYKGVDSPQGVYTYYIKFTTVEGHEFEKRGTVTLIR